MEKFSYKIQEEHGIHARCAGKLVGTAQGFNSNITIEHNTRVENLKRLFAVSCMGVKKGDVVTVKFDGEDEAEASQVIENYFKENL